MTFNIFLFEDGEVFASPSVEASTKKLVQLNCSNIVKIAAGYSHAVMLDCEGKIYTYGANNYGQLGINKMVSIRQKAEVHAVTAINEHSDKVKLIACGPNYTLAYTELGSLYYWGYLVPDDLESVEHSPSPLQISLFQDDQEEKKQPYLTDIKATLREIIACDSKGRLYRTEIVQSQILKPMQGGMGGLEHRVGAVYEITGVNRGGYLF